MFTFKTCTAVPVRGGRGYVGGGGVVEMEGMVVWGGGVGEVYRLDEVSSKWVKLANVGEIGATLVVCGGELVSVSGFKDTNGVQCKEVKVLRGGRWTSMTEMLIGCGRSCVVSVSGGGLLVMGGGGGGLGNLNDVQIFDGRAWRMGPPLPRPCKAMSAVIDGDLVFVVGGRGMERAVWSANITDLVSHFTLCSIYQFMCIAAPRYFTYARMLYASTPSIHTRMHIHTMLTDARSSNRRLMHTRSVSIAYTHTHHVCRCHASVLCVRMYYLTAVQTSFVIVVPSPLTNMHPHILTRLLHTLMTYNHLSGGSYQMYHTITHLYVWLMVCC